MNEFMGLQVLQVLIDRNTKPKASLLTVQDLGRLSIASKKVAGILDRTFVWKNFFEMVADAGRGTYNGCIGEGHFLLAGHVRGCETWNHEDGWLACFSDPQDAVIAKVGYKRAARCLYGKTCSKVGCDRMTGRANPVTMERMCMACYGEAESSWLVSKSKAKEAFLLTEKDCKSLPKSEFASADFMGRGCTACVMLVEDVKKAALDKFGGADGLSTEIRKRKAAADERFRKSQGTDKPQKKRSKIERLTDRPADNLKRVAFGPPGLPIGTFYSKTKMTHYFSCTYDGCGIHGNLADVVMHEKLEHGFSTSFHRRDPIDWTVFPPPTNCQPFDGLTPIAEMPGATTDLIQLFESASMQYSSLYYEVDDEHFDFLEERKMCFLSFAKNGVKVCVDRIKLPDIGGDSDHYIDLCFQTVSGQVPRKVMGVFLDQSDHPFHPCLQAKKEFHAGNFMALAAALGIDGVEPAQLISMFLLLVLRRDEAVAYKEQDGDDSDEDSDSGSSRRTVPIYEKIQDILFTE
jgi:hypothetical protein